MVSVDLYDLRYVLEVERAFNLMVGAQAPQVLSDSQARLECIFFNRYLLTR